MLLEGGELEGGVLLAGGVLLDGGLLRAGWVPSSGVVVVVVVVVGGGVAVGVDERLDGAAPEGVGTTGAGAPADPTADPPAAAAPFRPAPSDRSGGSRPRDAVEVCAGAAAGPTSGAGARGPLFGVVPSVSSVGPTGAVGPSPTGRETVPTTPAAAPATRTTAVVAPKAEDRTWRKTLTRRRALRPGVGAPGAARGSGPE